MRTSMILDDRLVKELMAVTGARTKTAAIHLAMSELIRRRKLEGLKALSGRIRLAEDWQAREELELKAQAKPEPSRRGHR